MGILCMNSCSHNSEVDSVVWNNGKEFIFENGFMYHHQELFSGEIVKFYLGNKTKSKTNYADGKVHGNFESWYVDGSIFEQRFFMNGLKIGVHQGWWSNGKKKFIYHFNVQGQYQGELKEWRESGEPFKVMNY